MASGTSFGLNIDVFSRNGNPVGSYGEWPFATQAQAQAGVAKAIYEISPKLKSGQLFSVRIVKHETVMQSARQPVEG